MNITQLRLAAVRFVMWQKRGMLFTIEQSDGCMGRPDVFCLTKSRETIEVEIKVSRSDFMRNRRKETMNYRAMIPERGPNYFYYLMPHGLAEMCVNDAEPHAGVIGVYGDGDTQVLKRPSKIHTAKTPVSRIATLIREQSSTSLGLLSKLYELQRDSAPPQKGEK